MTEATSRFNSLPQPGPRMIAALALPIGLLLGALIGTGNPTFFFAAAGLILFALIWVVYDAQVVLIAAIAVMLASIAVPEVASEIPGVNIAPMSPAGRGIFEFGIAAAAVFLTIINLSKGSDFRYLRIAYLAMFGLFAVFLVNSNVPSLWVGAQGIRLYMVAISGLMLGLSVPDQPKLRGYKLSTVISYLLLAAAVASLAVHIFAPGVEESITRSAGEATSSLEGETRMQGFLAGPFHVSILGVFLALAGTWRLMTGSRITGVGFFAVGLSLLLLARVRTGLIAFLFGLVLLLILLVYLRSRRSDSKKQPVARGRRRVLSILALVAGLFVIVAVAQNNVAVRDLGGVASDHRADSRFSTIEDGIDLIRESPITGWGPGSSASGLHSDFASVGKTNINPHSGVLGLLIEGGIGLLACFLVIAFLAGRELFRQARLNVDPANSGLAIAAITPLALFWLFGEGLATLPVSVCIALVLGICLANGAKADPESA